MTEAGWRDQVGVHLYAFARVESKLLDLVICVGLVKHTRIRGAERRIYIETVICSPSSS